jgi:hypothetical protein
MRQCSINVGRNKLQLRWTCEIVGRVAPRFCEEIEEHRRMKQDFLIVASERRGNRRTILLKALPVKTSFNH